MDFSPRHGLYKKFKKMIYVVSNRNLSPKTDWHTLLPFLVKNRYEWSFSALPKDSTYVFMKRKCLLKKSRY